MESCTDFARRTFFSTFAGFWTLFHYVQGVPLGSRTWVLALWFRDLGLRDFGLGVRLGTSVPALRFRHFGFLVRWGSGTSVFWYVGVPALWFFSTFFH